MPLTTAPDAMNAPSKRVIRVSDNCIVSAARLTTSVVGRGDYRATSVMNAMKSVSQDSV
jgi:hypothetical protein